MGTTHKVLSTIFITASTVTCSLLLVALIMVTNLTPQDSVLMLSRNTAACSMTLMLVLLVLGSCLVHTVLNPAQGEG